MIVGLFLCPNHDQLASGKKIEGFVVFKKTGKATAVNDCKTSWVGILHKIMLVL